MSTIARFSARTAKALEVLAERTELPTAEVVRQGLSVLYWLARERSLGSKLLIQRGDVVTELVVPSLDRLASGPPIPALGSEDPAGA
jgi:hypothetical protein